MKKTASTFVLLLLFASLFSQKPYRGAEVFSRDKVLYGKFEMRMKMIEGSGMLSTFFTIRQGSEQDDDYWAELDIEVLGKNSAEIMSTNIITDGVGGNLVHSTEEIHLDYSLADDFHTFSLEWTPYYVAWFIDGIEHRRDSGDVVNHLDLPQGYRFNAWISCSPGWVGSIDRDALPKYQYIDWIEYYSYNETTQDFTYEWRDDFDSFNTTRWSRATWTFDCNEVDFTPENAFIENGNLVLAISDPNPIIHEAPVVTEMDDIFLTLDGTPELITLSSVFASDETLTYEVSGAINTSATIDDGVLTISPLTVGTDVLTIKATTPFDMSASDEVSVMVGPSGIESNPSVYFTVVPNPSNGQFSIKLANDYSLETEVTIFSITGQLAHQQMVYSSFSEINVSHLYAGMYYLQISNPDGRNLKKIMIK